MNGCGLLQFSDAYENARFLCEQYYMAAPDCNFTCHNRKSDSGNYYTNITLNSTVKTTRCKTLISMTVVLMFIE